MHGLVRLSCMAAGLFSIAIRVLVIFRQMKRIKEELQSQMCGFCELSFLLMCVSLTFASLSVHMCA